MDEQTKAIVAEQTKNMIEINKAFIKKLKVAINHIEKTVSKENKDRLDYAYIIAESIKVLGSSIKGWEKWANLQTMHQTVPEEDLIEFAPRIFELTKQWTQIDIEVTENLIRRKSKTVNKPTKKKENYVS